MVVRSATSPPMRLNSVSMNRQCCVTCSLTCAGSIAIPELVIDQTVPGVYRHHGAGERDVLRSGYKVREQSHDTCTQDQHRHVEPGFSKVRVHTLLMALPAAETAAVAAAA